MISLLIQAKAMLLAFRNIKSVESISVIINFTEQGPERIRMGRIRQLADGLGSPASNTETRQLSYLVSWWESAQWEEGAH